MNVRKGNIFRTLGVYRWSWSLMIFLLFFSCLLCWIQYCLFNTALRFKCWPQSNMLGWILASSMLVISILASSMPLSSRPVRSRRNDCNILLGVYFYENGNSGTVPFESPTWRHIPYLNMSKIDRCSTNNINFHKYIMTIFLY